MAEGAPSGVRRTQETLKPPEPEPSLRKARLTHYDGTTKLPCDEEIRRTLEWAHRERSQGHDVPKWIYKLAWDGVVVP